MRRVVEQLHRKAAPLGVDRGGGLHASQHGGGPLGGEIRLRPPSTWPQHRMEVGTPPGSSSMMGFPSRISTGTLTNDSATMSSHIRAEPRGVATTTPFPADHDHAATTCTRSPSACPGRERGALEEFAGWYCGKASPVQLFWHSFDLALEGFGEVAQTWVPAPRWPCMPSAAIRAPHPLRGGRRGSTCLFGARRHRGYGVDHFCTVTVIDLASPFQRPTSPTRSVRCTRIADPVPLLPSADGPPAGTCFGSGATRRSARSPGQVARDRFGEALEPVAHDDAHVVDAPVLDLGEHPEPELGALAAPGRPTCRGCRACGPRSPRWRM